MKTLPIAMPPITSFPFIADLLSILWAHQSLTAPWIFDRYIQLQVETYNEPPILDFYDGGVRENDLLPAYFCPFIEWRRIDRERNYPPIESFVDYVRYQIDQDVYVDTPLDLYYLSCSRSYAKLHFIHETFIYGYNDKLKTVNVADFYDKGKFSFKSVSYDELENSGGNLTNFINLYSFRNFNYKFDLGIAKTFIEDFLHSRDSFAKYNISYEKRNKNVVFGLGVFDCLIDIFNMEPIINFQAYHVIYDHMCIMKSRIDYMYSLGHIAEQMYFELSRNIDTLIRSALLLRNMVLKYNYSHEISLVARINKKCEMLRNEEKQFFTKLLNTLL